MYYVYSLWALCSTDCANAKQSKIVNINKTLDSLLDVLQVHLLSFFILKMESKT